MPSSYMSASSLYGRSAAMGVTTHLQGFTQLLRALGRIDDETGIELRKRIREVGERVALVAAGNAPILKTHPSDSSGAPGELQHSIKTSVTLTRASVYSDAVYGGVQNVGGWSKGRGPHVSRARASHYMDKAVIETAPWVRHEMDGLIDWVESTFREG